LTVLRYPLSQYVWGGKIREGPQILVVTGTLLKYTTLPMEEVTHLVAKPIEISELLGGELHFRNCSKSGVEIRAFAFQLGSALSHFALDQ
jgi:hypothetical protein